MWLYIPPQHLPSTSSAYVPGLEVSNLESPSLSTIGERFHASSVLWRSKQQPPQAWSRRWKQGGFIRLLSGLICEPSTLDLGAASFISSLRATHAKTTALPESAPDQMAHGFWPPRSAGSLPSAGLILSSARTCRGTRTDSLKPSSRHWKDWATALRQEYSARPELAIPCAGSDCSSWPSAKVASGAWERDQNGNVYPTLEGAASQWEAPSVAVTDGTRLTRGGDRSNELLLTGQAVEASAQWSAPKASDGEKGGPNQRGSKASHQTMLCNFAPDWVETSCHPPSSPDPAIAGGAMSLTDSPNSNQPSVKRKLNPIFVEALMRWPTGLSGFERQATALIPSPPQSPSSAFTQNSENLHGRELPPLRQGNAATSPNTDSPMGEAKVLQPYLSSRGEATGGSVMREMRGELPAEVQSAEGQSILLTSLRQHGSPDCMALPQAEGRRKGAPETSRRHGEGVGPTAQVERDRPSPRSRQDEQRSVEFGGHDDGGAFQATHDRQHPCSPFLIWQQQQRSYLSALVSVSLEEPEQMAMF